MAGGVAHDMHTSSPMTNDPKWWKPEHNSTWDNIKSAMKRDWEQTKADLSSKGTELNQDAGDTVKQAAGKQAIPSASQPNSDWEGAETKYRYGVGAREQYGTEHKDWNDGLESKLKEEWQDLKDGTTWEEAKNFVRRGYERAKK